MYVCVPEPSAYLAGYTDSAPSSSFSSSSSSPWSSIAADYFSLLSSLVKEDNDDGDER